MMLVRGGEFLDQGSGNGIGWKYRIQKKKKKMPQPSLFHLVMLYTFTITT